MFEKQPVTPQSSEQRNAYLEGRTSARITEDSSLLDLFTELTGDEGDINQLIEKLVPPVAERDLSLEAQRRGVIEDWTDLAHEEILANILRELQARGKPDFLNLDSARAILAAKPELRSQIYNRVKRLLEAQLLLAANPDQAEAILERELNKP